MPAEAGIVITHAYTIELATFQRPAETPHAPPSPHTRAAPPPAPDAEDSPRNGVRRRHGNAEPGRHEQRRGAAGLRAKSLHRRQPGDPQAHGADDPPAAH